MANLVLYRKYRPQKFSEFIGQEHIVKTLTNAISSEMISHAYLFAGPKGSGKTTIARIFAKAVNCQTRKKGEGEEDKSSSPPFAKARDFEPCNKCSSCLEIMEGRSMDLMEIDAASHRGIDDIRELRDGIRFMPTKSKYKVFILDEAHQLSKDAANALLKTLEEPPSHAIFILATTEIHKMIPTIISRCQRFDFRRLTLPEIMKKLERIAEKEKVKVTETPSHLPPRPLQGGGSVIEKAALELIALNSEGSFRDAESLLDQVFTLYGDKEIKAEDIKDLLGLVETELVGKFTDFLAQKNPSGAINFLNEIVEKGTDLEEFAKTLINYLRKALILKIMGIDGNPIISGLTTEELQKLNEQAKNFKEEELKKILNLFSDAENKMKYSSIPQLPLELAIIEACTT